MNRFVALTVWGYLTWVVLSWTLTLEQQLFGLVLALLVAIAMWPLGPVVEPWRVLQPTRLLGLIRLLLAAAWSIARANVGLALRIWAPSRPLHSGMVIVPTEQHTDGGLAATGSITSLIVDNQIVDLDREQNQLQYHGVSIPNGTDPHPEAEINAPVERLLPPIIGRS